MMADDKSKTAQDRQRVSASEDYEVEHLVKKFGATKEAVIAAIKAHGPMRGDVEAALSRKG